VRAILDSVVRAVPLLFSARVLMSVLLPLAGGVLLWAALLLWAWVPLKGALSSELGPWLGNAALGDAAPWVVGFGAGLAAFLLITVTVGALVLAVIAVVAGPVFVQTVAARHFPALERKRGGTFAGAAWNALVTVAVWLPLWLLVLPLWFVPLLGVIATLVLSAWLNQRLFRYDALAEHASAAERRRILADARWRLLGLGLLLSPLALVPLANLVAPVLSGLAFTVLCLAELARLRGSHTAGALR